MWGTWGIGGMVKGRVCHSYSLEGMKRLHYRLLFQHNKSKRNKSQEQALCPILRCSFCHKTSSIPEPDGNIEYSSDIEHSDMTVVVEDDMYKPEEHNQSVSLTQAELYDLTWDWTFQKNLLSCWAHISRETSVVTRNNVLLLSRPWERIKMVFYIPG